MMRIDVAFIPVRAGAATDARMVVDLAPAERDTIRRLGVSADRDRAVTARAAARRELSRRLGVPPGAVALTSSPSGKPYVDGSSMGVSWSHSGSWVALAVAEHGPVGVDIERCPDEVPTRALAMLGLAAMEEFVAREAAGKVTGSGLAGSWPVGVMIRSLSAPVGYLAAVAATAGPLSIHCRGVADTDAHG